VGQAVVTPEIHIVDVFAAGPRGGNPAPIVIDAAGMSDAQMQDVARHHGHESGFVLPPAEGLACDFALRFWVPNHEMEMCGHATVGAVWLLDRLGRLRGDRLSLHTRSGRVEARIAERDGGGAHVEITQPAARIEALPGSTAAQAAILSVLRITANELAAAPIRNACTSRMKTLIPLESPAVLDALQPDFGRVEQVCAQIGSTGLYPYAVADAEARLFDARQFPKSSGYPEDAATGIAAAALAFGLLANGLVEADDQPIRVRQGRAMGRPSEIALRFRIDTAGRVCGCWLGGNVRFAESAKNAGAE
jgi:PhzF family phenazine biosynthesis protein